MSVKKLLFYFLLAAQPIQPSLKDLRESLLVILYFHIEPKVIFVLFFLQVTKEDFMSFEHILCMDESNLR